MKLARTSLDLLQTLLFCAILAIAPLAAASDNPINGAIAQQQIDINTADAATLAEVMDGVGMVKAEAIVAYREQVGKFQSVDQLLEVSGIGYATLENNRHKLTVVLE